MSLGVPKVPTRPMFCPQLKPRRTKRAKPRWWKRWTDPKPTSTVSSKRQSDVPSPHLFHPWRRKRRTWKIRTRTSELGLWQLGFSRMLCLPFSLLVTAWIISDSLQEQRAEAAISSKHCCGRQLLCLWCVSPGVVGSLEGLASCAVSIGDNGFCRASQGWFMKGLVKHTRHSGCNEIGVTFKNWSNTCRARFRRQRDVDQFLASDKSM